MAKQKPCRRQLLGKYCWFYIISRTTNDQKHILGVIVLTLEVWVAKISWEMLKILHVSSKCQEQPKLMEQWGEVILKEDLVRKSWPYVMPHLPIVSSHFAVASQLAFNSKGCCELTKVESHMWHLPVFLGSPSDVLTCHCESVTPKGKSKNTEWEVFF